MRTEVRNLGQGARAGLGNEKADSGIWREACWGSGIPALAPMSGARKAHRVSMTTKKKKKKKEFRGSRSISLDNRDQRGASGRWEREQARKRMSGLQVSGQPRPARSLPGQLLKARVKRTLPAGTCSGSHGGSPEGSCQS